MNIFLHFTCTWPNFLVRSWRAWWWLPSKKPQKPFKPTNRVILATVGTFCSYFWGTKRGYFKQHPGRVSESEKKQVLSVNDRCDQSTWNTFTLCQILFYKQLCSFFINVIVKIRSWWTKNPTFRVTVYMPGFRLLLSFGWYTEFRCWKHHP